MIKIFEKGNCCERENHADTIIVEGCCCNHSPINTHDFNILAEIKALMDKLETVKLPYIGDNGNWFYYDETKLDWIDSGVKAQGEKGNAGDIGPEGTKGDKGDTGEQGMSGQNGITPNIKIGITTTLPAIESATVELDELSTIETPIFNFGIPKGVDGTNSGDMTIAEFGGSAPGIVAKADKAESIEWENVKSKPEYLIISSSIYTTTHTGNAYSISISDIVSYSDLTGIPITIKFDAASTGAITLNVNDLGTLNLVDYKGSEIADVLENSILTAFYNPSTLNFMSANKGGGVNLTGDASPSDVIAGKTFYSNNSIKQTGTNQNFLKMNSDCKPYGDIIIPSSVTSIGNNAFYSCTSLYSVIIPSSVTIIKNSAFYACEYLNSVTIPSSVTSIEDQVFRNCTSLTSITIPDGITRIGAYTFSGTSLSTFTIPSSVTVIGDAAFQNCTSLTTITIPSSVTSIGNSVFYDCTYLNSVTIPSSVTSIGNSAFYCINLEFVTLGANFNASINISSSTKYSVDTLVSMFNALKNNVGFTARTLTLGATNLAKLSTAQKAIATNKNWVLA